MTTKVKNNKVSDDTWVGQLIVASAQFKIPEYRLAQWRTDNKVSTDIASGDLQIVREDGPPIIYYNAVDGQLAMDGYPSKLASTRGAFNVIIFARKQVSGTINKGIPVHISGYDVTDDVYLVEVADSDTSSFPAAGVVNTTNLSEVDVGHVVINGRLEKYNTSSWSVGDELYVSSSGTLTSTRPTGITNKVQRIGQVLYSHATDGVIGIMGANRGNDIPNITNGKVWMGDGSDLPVETDVYTEAEADSLLAGKLANIVEDTTPQLGGMLDINGFAIGDGTNELITFVEDPSAVNNIEIENQATGGGPIIRATGPDTNINFIIDPKGTGSLVLDGLNWPTADGTSGQVLTTDGSGSLSFSAPVFGSEHQEAESSGVSTTTGSTWKEKLEIVTGSLPSGKYRIGWYYEWQHTGTAGDVEVRLQVNNGPGHMNQLTETYDLGTDQWRSASGFVYKTAFSGINTIELDYRNRTAGTTGIRKARLEIWRIS